MEEWEEQGCRGRVFWRFKLKLRPNRVGLSVQASSWIRCASVVKRALALKSGVNYSC
jgi:hypothetical protein